MYKKAYVMHVQSCCFANLNLLLFCRCRWRRRRRCFELPVVWLLPPPPPFLLLEPEPYFNSVEYTAKIRHFTNETGTGLS